MELDLLAYIYILLCTIYVMINLDSLLQNILDMMQFVQ